jgi:hypothetical protein
MADANGCKVWDPHPLPNESVTWSGSCLEGYADGPGVVQWLADGQPGTRVEGTLARGKPVGKTTVVRPDGARFDGTYVDGERSGKGVWTWANGARYQGDWLHDQHNGVGVMTYANGDRYEGDWKDGKRSGHGVLTLHDGSRYDGEFVDDHPAHPELIKRKTYSLKETFTGSLIPKEQVTGVMVPADKSWEQLTPDEQQLVKAQYEPMAAGDEPPYPLHGQLAILDAAVKLQTRLGVEGQLTLAATIDPTGRPVSVDILRSPDKEMARQMALVLMLTKYKPARCGGAPCTMQYPWRMNFRLTQ